MEETIATAATDVVETTPAVLDEIYAVTQGIAAQMPQIAMFMQISVNLIVLCICSIGLTAGLIIGARLWGWLK